jgi:hypothetical protein
MLEYMGAWEWYDRQVKLTQAKYEAEKKMPLHRKTAGSYVLSDLPKSKTPGKSIKGIGRINLGRTLTILDYFLACFLLDFRSCFSYF